jgi:hypothetical protein
MYGFKQGLDSFWHVQHRYDNTKPMVSKYHTKEQNLRPAGRNRSRKWEHIRKLSETCYALCDGGYGDPVFISRYRGAAPTEVSAEDTYNLSPIVWEIMEQPDGSYLETIKIRNDTGDYAHTSRYSFLYEFLPDNMRFIVGQNGRQYVGAGKVYYLPKSKSVDELRWEHIVRSRTASSTNFQREDDQKYLRFGRTTRVDWELISPEFQPVNPKSKVDKERKKELKPHLDTFWEWACAVGQMLPTNDWEYMRGVKDTLRNAGVIQGWAFSANIKYNGDKVQSVITDDSHELRLPLLAMFMLRSDMKHANTPEDAKKVRARFNQWANRACGLVTTTKGK